MFEQVKSAAGIHMSSYTETEDETLDKAKEAGLNEKENTVLDTWRPPPHILAALTQPNP